VAKKAYSAIYWIQFKDVHFTGLMLNNLWTIMGKKSDNFRIPDILSENQGKDCNGNNEQITNTIASIDKMHQMDLEAFKTNNIDMLVKLVTDDCIMLPPAQGPICGREAIRNYFKEKFMEWKAYKVAFYDQQFEEVKLMGELAYEWGTSKGVFYMKNGGPDIFENSRLFRILRSQPDGSWKIARVIWNDVP
jgi:ketosteroid isomerase-like protein